MKVKPFSCVWLFTTPWTVAYQAPQSMGSLRVGHDWATSLHFSLSCIGERNGNPLQCSCLENPREGGAWWTVVYGVAQSWTWLKWLSSRSGSSHLGKLNNECMRSQYYFLKLNVKLYWFQNKFPFLKTGPVGYDWKMFESSFYTAFVYCRDWRFKGILRWD